LQRAARNLDVIDAHFASNFTRTKLSIEARPTIRVLDRKKPIGVLCFCVVFFSFGKQCDEDELFLKERRNYVTWLVSFIDHSAHHKKTWNVVDGPVGDVGGGLVAVFRGDLELEREVCRLK
jgi:hypothetical protein